MKEISEFSHINGAVCELDLAATNAINSGAVLHYEFYTDKEKRISKAQKGAMYVWFDLVADTFNHADMYFATRVKFNGEQVNVEWDGDLVKKWLYKPALASMTGKASTEDQSTVEPSIVAQALQKHFALNHGLNLPDWPSLR